MSGHRTAIISPEAEIASDVEIGPYCIIEDDVKIASGTKLLAYVHIKGNTHIGQNNLIHSGCVLGEKPQMLGLRNNPGRLEIGNDNIIREYVTVHTSTSQENTTLIGDDNYLMGFSHIAHDCRLGNGIILCNGSLLAGHTEIQDKVFISGNVVVHQFVRIGRLAMIAGLARVNQDVPPYMLLVGNSRIWGVNLIGLKRAKFNSHEIKAIKRAFDLIYRKGLPPGKYHTGLEEIDSPQVKEIKEFIQSSQRGISGTRRSDFWERIFLDYPLLVRIKIATYRKFTRNRNC